MTIERGPANAKRPVPAFLWSMWCHEHAVLVIPGRVERRRPVRHDAIKRAETLKPRDGVGIDHVGGHRIAGQLRAIEDGDGHTATREMNSKARSCDPASDDDYILFCSHDHSRSDNKLR